MKDAPYLTIVGAMGRQRFLSSLEKRYCDILRVHSIMIYKILYMLQQLCRHGMNKDL